MLRTRPLLARDSLLLADVACQHRRGPGREELADCHALVFVRRGRFERIADGRRAVLDRGFVYAMVPGQTQRYDHLDDAGDACTWLRLSPDRVAELRGGVVGLPIRPWIATERLGLLHRRLLAAARRGQDPDEVEEQALGIAATALEHVEEAPTASGRPARLAARRALADEARDLLDEDPSRTLLTLAQALAVSPHHLSRVVHEHVGCTVSQLRRRLRVQMVLDRLEAGEENLARLAADAGFADHSHLTRTVQRALEHTPSQLRASLRPRLG